MKTVEELNKISNECASTVESNMLNEDEIFEYSIEVITNILNNLSDNAKINRCIRIGYLIPMYDGSIQKIDESENVDGYIDLRKQLTKPSQPYNVRIKNYMTERGFKMGNMDRNYTFPKLVIGW